MNSNGEPYTENCDKRSSYHSGRRGPLPRAGPQPTRLRVAPSHWNAVTLTYSLQDGDVVFDPSFPIQNAHGRIGNELFTLFHSVDFFGRSSNINITLPYAVGHFNGEVNGVEEKLYRSGLGPLVARFSVNVLGARSMQPREFAEWKQKTLVGVSLTVQAPTGQYDSSRLVNISNNRWAFKPEAGLSRRWGKWVLDAYGAAWLFTANDNYWSNAPGTHPPNRQTQNPMGATELHLSYNITPRAWVSIDGNYWYGGATSVNAIANAHNSAGELAPRRHRRHSHNKPPVDQDSATAAAPTSPSAATSKTSHSPGNTAGSAAPSSPNTFSQGPFHAARNTSGLAVSNWLATFPA